MICNGEVNPVRKLVALDHVLSIRDLKFIRVVPAVMARLSNGVN